MQNHTKTFIKWPFSLGSIWSCNPQERFIKPSKQHSPSLNTLGTTFVRLVKEEIVTKTISNRVNRSLRGGHLVIGPVLFPAVSSRKRPAQALRWLSITKKCSVIPITHFNGCASEDKSNNSLVKSTNPTAPPS